VNHLENFEIQTKQVFFSDLFLTLPKKKERPVEKLAPKAVERIHSFGGGFFGLEVMEPLFA